MDSVPRIVYAMQTAAADTGLAIPSESDIRNIIGLSMAEAFLQLFGADNTEYLSRLSSSYSAYYLSPSSPTAHMFPDYLEVLQLLYDEGVKLAVATGKTRKGLDRVLTESGVSHLFSYTRCACEAESKPSPDMLNQIIDELEVEKHECVMIGDSMHDLAMANNAGIDSIGITHGAHDREQLRSQTPIAIVDSLEALCDLFRYRFNVPL